MTKLQRILAVANQWEATGKAIFSRNSDGSMSIRLRDPRLWGGNPNVEHWQNARALESQIHEVTKHTSSIEIDRQAGHLVLTVYNAYPTGGAQ